MCNEKRTQAITKKQIYNRIYAFVSDSVLAHRYTNIFIYNI